MASYITARYPNIIVSGGEYPATPTNQMLAKVVTYAQYGIMLVMVAGDWIFRQIGIPPPAIYYKLKEKQFIVIMAVMFLGNNLSNSLTSTGAFEISIDNQLIFSKLQTGRMPSPQEVEGRLF